MKSNKSFFFLPSLLSLIILFGTSLISNGQAAKSSDYPTNPSWVQMMSDPNANYFKAVKAYEEYWKHHEKPTGEEEQMGKNNKNKSDQEIDHKNNLEKEKAIEKNQTPLTKKDLQELEWKQEMTYQCKRFEDWMRSVKPFVQNDGRILTSEEQMKMYDKRQEEIQKNQH